MYKQKRKLSEFEADVNRAYLSIKEANLHNEDELWLRAILSILAQKKYARVLAKNCLIDVEAIAHTNMFSSFYDIFNKRHMFVTSVMPVVVNELKNPYRLLCGDAELW